MGLPSTALVSLAFIGNNQGPQAVFHATAIMPLILSAVSVFLVVFKKTHRKGMLFALSAALFSWFLLSFTAILFRMEEMVLNSVISLLILCFGYVYFREVRDGKTDKHAFQPKEF